MSEHDWTAMPDDLDAYAQRLENNRPLRPSLADVEVDFADVLRRAATEIRQARYADGVKP